jgi:hypothetical protein
MKTKTRQPTDAPTTAIERAAAPSSAISVPADAGSAARPEAGPNRGTIY